ncbi:MAG: hypothetical protein Tp172MES00d2C118481931_1 [Prokaryotic dsDNA virus sp.]|nr:MAG: hypothetical protein Tp172MES00d2C118481931_1 [Prokaryotic dsDNA virus sp.]
MLHLLLTTNPLYEHKGFYYTLNCFTKRDERSKTKMTNVSLFGKEVYFKHLWFVKAAQWLFYPNHVITKCNRRSYPKLDKVWYD